MNLPTFPLPLNNNLSAKLKAPAPKGRGSPSPTCGTQVGLGDKAQNYNLKRKGN